MAINTADNRKNAAEGVNYYYDAELKRDAFGNVDTDYYVELSRELQYDYLSQLAGALKTRIKGLFALPQTRHAH
ncbi:hypothetical protein ACKC9G_14425 [Pokkaliibacter sp. CJK22405]|uniref:hypothetical protein n=1 Tax=Pokkaliibacter sp. CJK22405 TaxID=3384615 RepID=UPI003984C04C